MPGELSKWNVRRAMAANADKENRNFIVRVDDNKRQV